MTEVTRIKTKLEKVGLTEKQADIYILLLRQGSLRVSDIVRALHIPRSSIYESLGGLFKLGLAEEIIENSFKRIRAYPIGSIRHRFDEKIVELQKQTEELSHLEKTLDVLPSLTAPPATIIRYYKGQTGARQLFWNTLKGKNTLYVYSEWGRGRYVGIKFYKNFVAESYTRGFKEHVITNSSPRVLDSIREHIDTPVSRTKLENIRTVPDAKIPFKGETLMYDNIYAQVYLKNEEINGFEIESKQFLETQRAIFEMLWETAEPVSKYL